MVCGLGVMAVPAQQQLLRSQPNTPPCRHARLHSRVGPITNACRQDEGFRALEGRSAPAAPATGAAAPEPDGEEWEDVAETGGDPGGAAAAAAGGSEAEGEEEEEEVEGLAAYAREEPPDALLAAAAAGAAGDPGGPGPRPAGASWAAPDPAVARVLRELGRVAAHRHLPAVRDWLRVLVKARSGPAC